MANTRKNGTVKSNRTIRILKKLFICLYKLRGLVLGIPVAVTAVVMAINNQVRLPDMVDISLMATEETAIMVGKSVAVLGPLALTGICLVLVFCSRKVLYPWLISLFSLVLPLLILFVNSFG